MTGRPVGAPPLWASDPAFDDAGKDWDGEPNAIMPSAGYIAQGHKPERRRPVEYDNAILRDLTARLANLDMLEACNWPSSGEAASIATGSANSPGNMTAWGPTEEAANSSLLFVNGGTSIYASSDGGVTWAATNTDAGAATRDIASAPNAVVAAIATEGGDAKVIYKLAVGGWMTQALSASDDVRVIVRNPYSTDADYMFWAAGLNGTTPRAWRLDFDDGTAAPTQTIVSATSGTNRLDLLAPGPSKILAAVQFVASSSDVLYSFLDTDSGNAMVALSAPTAEPIQDLVYAETDGLWLMVTDASVFVSSDGTTWTSRSGGLPGGASFGGRCACIRGSMWLIVGTAAGAKWIFISGDAGVTWSILPDPLARHTGVTVSAAAISKIGNRLVVRGVPVGSTDVYCAYGLRTGALR